MGGFRGVSAVVATALVLLLPTLAGARSQAAPPNDDFAQAAALTGASGSATGTNVSATKQAGEPATVAGNSGGASIWFTWTAPASGSASITTAGSNFDTLLGVYTGSAVDALTLVAANDDTGSGRQSAVTFQAVSGTAYRILVDGYHGSSSGQATGNVTVNWNVATPPPAPANDMFSAAQTISGASGTANGTNANATKEAGEPATLAGNAGGASVWYAWTAPSSGTVTFSTAGSAFDTLLGVYTGSAVNALTLVKDNDDVSNTDRTSSVTFAATAGTTYRVVVDGYHGSSAGQASGAVKLGWSLAAAASGPANDNFANAQAVSGATGSATGTNVGATKESGEPATVAGNSGGASVWYAWTAPASGAASVTTAGSSFDTLLGVYTGSAVNALTLVAENDDTGSGRTSAVSFQATAGTTYRVLVDGYRGASQATGNVTVNWSVAAPPPGPANDNFASAQAISGASGSTTGTTVNATKEAGEPATVAGNSGGASVWYAWTAPSTGTATIATAGSSFDTLLGVYTGSAVNALTLVKDNDDVSSSDHTSSVSFAATAGTTYRILVDGYRGASAGQASGSVSLTWSYSSVAPSAPANDAFANAQSLSGASGTVNGTNVGATKETGEPALAGNTGGASIWYAWTAPSSGTLAVDTLGSAFDTLLGAYTGASVSALTLVASNDDATDTERTSAVSFAVTAGTRYAITVDGYHGPYSGQASGAVTMHWTFTPASGGGTGGDPVVLAAGDVHANCTDSQAAATAAVVQGVPSALVLLIGDATDNGSAQQFSTCYGPTWGAFKDRTRPAPGNHDYDTPNASGYFGYFGASAGPAQQGYYSFDVGAWHVLSLNSNCSWIGGCGAEVTWIQQDLAAHPTACTLAYFHHPVFTSTPEPTGNDGPVAPLFQALYDGHVDLLLNGHSRAYERFAPQNPSGQADANGVREFVVGTGGGSLDATNRHAANSQVWQASTFGVLQLTLHANGYDWKFLPVAGKTWTDSGTGACH